MAKPLTDEFTAGIDGLDRSFVVLVHPSGFDLSNSRLRLLIRQLTDHRRRVGTRRRRLSCFCPRRLRSTDERRPMRLDGADGDLESVGGRGSSERVWVPDRLETGD
ncbi:hypothetical protein ACFQ6Q_29735 [Streptomyces sp. NPDC056437]|uniref:hypothetical protein n=1 Tax=Streptomyces sp. NPDC056437 TaxID=3345816 RepID=UPI003690613B